jgi:putative ABC transport system ATP-binding protein
VKCPRATLVEAATCELGRRTWLDQTELPLEFATIPPCPPAWLGETRGPSARACEMSVTDARGSPIIRLVGVSKSYYGMRTATAALRDIHLEIFQGEYVAIAGPSGCGKTTLLSIIGLLDHPSAGSYELCGKATAEMAPRDRAQARNRHIGIVFQSYNLFRHLTVSQNVEFALTWQKVRAKVRKRRVREVLEDVGLSDKLNRRPPELSGGEQQRVAIARAIAARPGILLADEPTASLDSANGETVMDLLQRLHEAKTTICLATHDQRWAERAERIVHLLDGQIEVRAAL